MEHDNDSGRRGGAAPGWPGMALGLAVAAIFLAAAFAAQVQETEWVVRTTFDRVDPDPLRPGLNFRWPYPVQKLHRFDNRLRSFSGNEGKVEEVYTADGKNIVVSLFALYRIKEPIVFFQRLKSVDTAEERLNFLLRGAKNNVVGRHTFDEFVNTDPARLKLAQIEAEMLAEVKAPALADYGIEVAAVGVKFLGLPESITKEVFERMKSERRKLADKYIEEGKSLASQIRERARKESSDALAAADADARRIRGEGDALAAAAYAVFNKNPELAAFLRKLEALKKSIDAKTTLILDTGTPPFDLLGGGYEDFVTHGDR